MDHHAHLHAHSEYASSSSGHSSTPLTRHIELCQEPRHAPTTRGRAHPRCQGEAPLVLVGREISSRKGIRAGQGLEIDDWPSFTGRWDWVPAARRHAVPVLVDRRAFPPRAKTGPWRRRSEFSCSFSIISSAPQEAYLADSSWLAERRWRSKRHATTPHLTAHAQDPVLIPSSPLLVCPHGVSPHPRQRCLSTAACSNAAHNRWTRVRQLTGSPLSWPGDPRLGIIWESSRTGGALMKQAMEAPV